MVSQAVVDPLKEVSYCHCRLPLNIVTAVNLPLDICQCSPPPPPTPGQKPNPKSPGAGTEKHWQANYQHCVTSLGKGSLGKSSPWNLNMHLMCSHTDPNRYPESSSCLNSKPKAGRCSRWSLFAAKFGKRWHSACEICLLDDQLIWIMLSPPLRNYGKQLQPGCHL